MPAVLILGLILVAATIWVFRAPLAAIFREREVLHAYLNRYGAWAPVVFMALQAAQVILAPIPGHILAVMAGTLFGPWRGTAYSALGVGAGCAIVLTLSRLCGRPLVRRLLSPGALQRVDGWTARHGPVFFFLFFLFPFLPDDLACFAVGLSPLPLLPMLALIVLARLPSHFASAWIGATAHRLPPAAWAVILALLGVLLVVYARHRLAIERWLMQRLERADRKALPPSGR